MSVIKSRASFFAVLGLIAAAFAVIFVLFSGIIRAAAALFLAIAAAYWSVFFHTIGYGLKDGELTVLSGVFIRRARKIELSEVVLETSISIGSLVFFTLLRTAGGGIMIFGKIESS